MLITGLQIEALPGIALQHTVAPPAGAPAAEVLVQGDRHRRRSAFYLGRLVGGIQLQTL